MGLGEDFGDCRQGWIQALKLGLQVGLTPSVSLSLSLPYSGPAPPCSSKDSFYDTSSGLRVGEERFLKGKSNFLPKRRGGGGLGPRQLSATGHTGQAQRPAQELRARMDVESLVCLSTHAEP